jgi:hypothetical protein
MRYELDGMIEAVPIKGGADAETNALPFCIRRTTPREIEDVAGSAVPAVNRANRPAITKRQLGAETSRGLAVDR